MNEIIGVITVIIAIILYGFYLKDTITGKITPHPFSWAIWLVIMGTVFFAQISDNAGPGAWMSGVVTVFNLIILIASLKNGFKNIIKLDIVVFIIGLSAIPMWLITKDPTASVIVVVVVIANTISYIPTYRKSWHKPYEEPVYLYGVNFFRHGLSIIALANYSLITVLSPAVMIVNNGAFALFLLWLRHKQQKQ